MGSSDEDSHSALREIALRASCDARKVDIVGDDAFVGAVCSGVAMMTVMIWSASSPAVVDQLRVAVDAALGVVLSTEGPDTALRQAWPYLQHAEVVLEHAAPDEIDVAVARAVREACRAVRAQNFGDTRVALVTARGRLVRPEALDHKPEGPESR